MKNQLIFLRFGYVLIIPLLLLLSTCSLPQTTELPESRVATRIALDWNRLLLELEWHTPGYRAPISARMFAYTEMAAYESALPAIPGNKSMDRTHPGYLRQTVPAENYHLPVALNTAFATMARAFFSTAPGPYFEKIQRLEAKYILELRENTDAVGIQTSIDFGRQTAEAVWRYALQDSIGHDGVMHNFDSLFVGAKRVGCWKIDTHQPIAPLLPHWGEVRPFAVDIHDCKALPPIPFDEHTGSAFFSEAMEVFTVGQSLTAEERWIAEFWSDDLPGLTITPAGRWISITTQALEKSQLNFPMIMETYLKTAIVLNDAAIAGWKNKYIYQVERPDAYIRRNIQTNWKPFHSSPAFPSYPSGHAIFGAAVAEVLSLALGEQFEFIDCTHQGRKEFMGSPRKFNSFRSMANENAYSRLLIGVHFRNDCEEGLRLGKSIGKQVAGIALHDAIVASVSLK